MNTDIQNKKWTNIVVQLNEQTGECGLQFVSNITNEESSIVAIGTFHFRELAYAMLETADRADAINSD